ncbi:MAG: HesA/MoeB/ThiF family protein [Bacteroidota bacterium]
MQSKILTNQEIRRYHKQIILPEIGIEGQEKIKQSSVLVIGAGGLGTPVLQYLAAAGVGTIGISDNDLVDETNLQRQVLYGSNDLGKQKAIISREKLRQLNHMNNYMIHNIFLSGENINTICSDYDVIIDATDNFESRFRVADICRHISKPIVYGAIYKYEGQVTVFNYNEGPGIRDLFPDLPGREQIPENNDTGVLGVLPGIIGTLQAAEALKIITGIGHVLSGKLLMINLLKGVFKEIVY